MHKDDKKYLSWKKASKNDSKTLTTAEPIHTLELFRKSIMGKQKKFYIFYPDQVWQCKTASPSTLSKVMNVSRDTKIEWLYSENLHAAKEKANANALKIDLDGAGERSIGKLIGLRMHHANHQADFTSPNDQELTIFKDKIARFFTFLNFHETYEAIQKLGKGNFASVYLAKNLENNRHFAVKAFSKKYLENEDRGEQSLENEIEIMRALNHESIIRLYEVYETENSFYLVMELLKGGQFIKKLSKEPKYSEEDISIILKRILEGLDYMEKAGVIHRDLKPENLLLKDSHNVHSVKIVDFGLASFTNVKEYLFSRCGTPGYVAPEILSFKKGDKKYEYKCDVFSLGVIFYVLLTGKGPIKGKNAEEVVTNNKNCVIDFNIPELKVCSSIALDLLMKMLEKNPDKRPSAKECLAHHFITRETMNENFKIHGDDMSKLEKNMENMKINNNLYNFGKGAKKSSPTNQGNQLTIPHFVKINNDDGSMGSELKVGTPIMAKVGVLRQKSDTGSIEQIRDSSSNLSPDSSPKGPISPSVFKKSKLGISFTPKLYEIQKTGSSAEEEEESSDDEDQKGSFPKAKK